MQVFFVPTFSVIVLIGLSIILWINRSIVLTLKYQTTVRILHIVSESPRWGLQSYSVVHPHIITESTSPVSVRPTCLRPQPLCLSHSQAWNVLALDGSNWQKIDLFNFQTDIEVRGVLRKMRETKKLEGVEWTSFMCVCVCLCTCLYVLQVCVNVCACWVALSSPRLSAGSVGFGANRDVTADPLSCGPSHITLTLSLCPLCLSGAGGGEHFEALWRLPEAAEPQGLPECGGCLHEVRFSLSLWHTLSWLVWFWFWLLLSHSLVNLFLSHSGYV